MGPVKSFARAGKICQSTLEPSPCLKLPTPSRQIRYFIKWMPHKPGFEAISGFPLAPFLPQKKLGSSLIIDTFAQHRLVQATVWSWQSDNFGDSRKAFLFLIFSFSLIHPNTHIFLRRHWLKHFNSSIWRILRCLINFKKHSFAYYESLKKFS